MRQGNSMLGGISTCSDSAHLSHLRDVADVVDAFMESGERCRWQLNSRIELVSLSLVLTFQILT